MLGAALKAAAAATENQDIESQVTFAEDLSPRFISNKLLELGDTCNAVAGEMTEKLVQQYPDLSGQRQNVARHTDF